MQEKKMAVKIDKEKCIRCGTCSSVCPMGVYEKDNDGYPVPDNNKCISCGLCVNLCPVGAITFDEDE